MVVIRYSWVIGCWTEADCPASRAEKPNPNWSEDATVSTRQPSPLPACWAL